MPQSPHCKAHSQGENYQVGGAESRKYKELHESGNIAEHVFEMAKTCAFADDVGELRTHSKWLLTAWLRGLYSPTKSPDNAAFFSSASALRRSILKVCCLFFSMRRSGAVVVPVGGSGTSSRAVAATAPDASLSARMWPPSALGTTYAVTVEALLGKGFSPRAWHLHLCMSARRIARFVQVVRCVN